MVDLVLGAGGSLKAEHGTGRTMAPFVRRQYGDELYDVMREIKRLCDPDGILNPGVMLDDDPEAHLRHLKTTPPGRGRGGPLRRVRLLRAGLPEQGPDDHPAPAHRAAPRLAAAASRGRPRPGRGARGGDYGYDVVDTCAVDGMCETACPVHINTGDLVKRLRRERQGPRRAGGRTHRRPALVAR